MTDYSALTKPHVPVSKQDITKAVEILKNGGLVAMPTETVYGLAADAKNDAAIRKLYQIKGRPGDHPVIVHLPSSDQLEAWVMGIPPLVHVLADAFWPGPMTLVLKKRPEVSGMITGGQDTVAIRIPAHPTALALLKAFGSALVAPSANRFGRISPTSAAHVREDLADDVALVLDGGHCSIGVESTIIDCSSISLSGDKPAEVRILRPGMLSVRDIELALETTGLSVKILPFESRSSSEHAAGHSSSENGSEQKPIRVSGALESHYAPNTPVRLLAGSELNGSTLKNNWRRFSQDSRIAVLAFDPCPEDFTQDNGVWLTAATDEAQYARELYANLRALDKTGAALILIAFPPEAQSDSQDWTAVMDRLSKAAAPRPPAHR